METHKNNIIPDNIIAPIMRRDCLIFIGAGMSIEAGLPSGSDLAKKLVAILEKDGYTAPSDFTLPRIAQDFENKRSRLELVEIIRNEIVNSMSESDPTSYDLLSKLAPLPNYIITTNYDRLLEKAIGEQNYMPIYHDRAMGKCTDSKMNLHKIHGDVDRLEDAIITEEDIRSYKNIHSVFLDEIKALFQKMAVIFIGFSVEDAHIRNIYKEMRDKLGDSAPLAYAVTPDDSSTLRFEEIGVKQIKLGASDFLTELLEKVEECGYDTIPCEIPQQSRPNYNPFSIYSTEYFLEDGREELINNTFIEPIDFARVVEPGNTIIEGHRGSGKSMILKYLSYEAQVERKFCEQFDDNYIGIYLKLKISIAITTTKKLFKGKDAIQWPDYFMCYVNLLIGEEIIRTLKLAVDNKIVSLDSEEDFISEVIYLFFESVSPPTSEMTLRHLMLMINKIRNSFAQNHCSDWTLSSDFLEQLFSTIKNYAPKWQRKNIYILLDEYDNLDDDQQRVVNTLIKNRSFSYKVGVKLCDMIYEDIGGKILERNNDYTYVSTDRFDADYNKFEKFIRNIANKRLEAYHYDNTIDEILPFEDDEKNRGFEQRDYSGFTNIVKLSSGIVRDFLELCKDMVYYSNPWVMEEDRDKIDIIIPNYQNTIIKIHSNIHYASIHSITGIDEDSQKSRSENARLMVDSLAQIFQNILKGSRSKEKRTVSGFQLRGRENLTMISKMALSDMVSYRLLQVLNNPRSPHNTTEDAPYARYKFHRLLCPRFKLGLADKWPKEIDAKMFNQIFDRPEKMVKLVSKHFLSNIHDTPSHIKTEIINFEGESE